jgi:hypothetical protein
MAIWHTPMAVGAINTSWSTSVKHTFATPRSVWGYTMLHDVLVYDDPGRANARVVQVVDNNVTKNVDWVGFFGQKVTSITYRLDVSDAWARASGVTHIFS